MEQILQDPRWRVVFLDDSIIILTDEIKYSDIRSDKRYMTQLVSSQDNYLSLLRLTSILSVMGKNNLGNQAFIKAQKINPSSCTIQRAISENDVQNKSGVCSSFFSF